MNRSPVVRRICAGLHQLIAERGYSQVTLDFSESSIVSEAVMLPILPTISKYRESHGVSFDIVLPRTYELYRLFDNANWGFFIDPSRFSENPQRKDQVPAQQFDNTAIMNQLVSNIVSLVLKRTEVDRSTLHTVEWSLYELMENVISHAESEVGGFVQATAFENRVEFIVADAGIGIPRSLGIRDDEQALLLSIAEGHTRDSNSNAGNGLFGSFRAASLSGSQFEILSYNGHLYYDQNRDAVQTRQERVPYIGTSVRCGIGLSEPDLLHKALSFTGTLHKPAGYIELEFENDEGEIVFRVKDHAGEDTGSRAGGIRCRRLIENLLLDEPRVTIDFADVPVISSSFADEVFGRLFVDLGPRAFMSRIQIRRANATVDGLIDRAILQRTRLSRSG